MKPGGTYRVEVPPTLCWGETKVLPRLGPNAPTVWQIEVVKTVRFAPLDPAKAKKTESGLEYEVIEEGTGAMPGPTAQVAVHYTGWLENGTEFDSSHRRGQPAKFPVNGVIKGWIEGLQLMKEGATYRFRIPAALAYGGEAKGDLIGFLDADGTYPPEYLPELCKSALEGADVVVGSRRSGAASEMPAIAPLRESAGARAVCP